MINKVCRRQTELPASCPDCGAGLYDMCPMNYRKAEDRPIDDANSRIAGAMMVLTHSFTPEATAAALDELCKAQRYLARALAAKAAWNAVEHDDYELYPDVPYDDQLTLPL